jgi:CheY-like chemotaxis protein
MVNKKKNRHVALVVEDDLELADEVKDLLSSLGHDVLHVPTQEEALEILETKQFCFALLDLQIKVSPDSIKPRVEAGKTLMKLIRERYHRRNPDDHHYLQILTMSGYVKETPDVVQLLQDGADDFISKPLSSNTPPISTKIEECLRKSGRSNHSDCATMMELAEGKLQRDDATGATISNGVVMSITGEPDGKRTGIHLDEKSIFLPDSQLILLLKLVVECLKPNDGWVQKKELGAKDEQGFKGISNLNGKIQPFLPPGTVFYENDKNGSYRINPQITIGEVNHRQLDGHLVKAVKNLSTEIKMMR